MADNLEFASKEKTYTVAEMIDDRLTHVLVRLHDLGELRPELKGVMDSIRSDVVMIRSAVDKAWGFSSTLPKPEAR